MIFGSRERRAGRRRRRATRLGESTRDVDDDEGRNDDRATKSQLPSEAERRRVRIEERTPLASSPTSTRIDARRRRRVSYESIARESILRETYPSPSRAFPFPIRVSLCSDPSLSSSHPCPPRLVSTLLSRPVLPRVPPATLRVADRFIAPTSPLASPPLGTTGRARRTWCPWTADPESSPPWPPPRTRTPRTPPRWGDRRGW